LDILAVMSKTVADIVDRLGGRDAVATLCGVTRNAVANWCAWDTFPKRVHLDLLKACRDKRIRLPEELFAGREQRCGVT
jgi:hypothetical protein